MKSVFITVEEEGRWYEIEVVDLESGSRETYTAGNAYGDSQGYVEPGSEHAHDFETMRTFALSTAREMAIEHEAELVEAIEIIKKEEVE